MMEHNKPGAAQNDSPLQRRAEGMRQFASSIGISYDTVFRAANDGRLRTIKFGKKRLDPSEEIERVSREGL